MSSSNTGSKQNKIAKNVLRETTNKLFSEQINIFTNADKTPLLKLCQVCFRFIFLLTPTTRLGSLKHASFINLLY